MQQPRAEAGHGTPPPGRATVGVMGSGSEEHVTLAEPLGALLAHLEVNLLTGAGKGVMTSVSRAYTASPRVRGISIGIVPCVSLDDRAHARPGYPNPFVELAIRTHLPLSGAEGRSDLSRNHINVLTCAAIVALPGGAGTASEIALALDYGKPVIAFAGDASALAGLPPGSDRAVGIDEVEAFLREHAVWKAC